MNTRHLELEELENMIINIITHINRPIRETVLIKMVTDLFEANTPKQVKFGILSLLEQEKLFQKGYYLFHNSDWDGTVTAIDNACCKYLLSLKEPAKEYFHLYYYATEPLHVNGFFYYVHRYHKGILHSDNIAHEYLQFILDNLDYSMSNCATMAVYVQPSH